MNNEEVVDVLYEIRNLLRTILDLNRASIERVIERDKNIMENNKKILKFQLGTYGEESGEDID